jgi:hypothetical protein
MDLFVKHQNQRSACWPAIEQFFGLLSPDLFRQAVILKTHLGLTYSSSGRFRDIFTRSHDHPLLYLHFWLLDDWNETATLARKRLEKHLLPAGVLSATAYHLWENIPYEDNIFDESFLGLIPHLLQEAWGHLVNIVPAGDLFWQQYQEVGFSEEFDRDAAQATEDEDVIPLTVLRPDLSAAESQSFGQRTNFAPPPSLAVFSQLSVAVTSLSSGRGEAVPDLLGLVYELNQGLQCYHDVLAIRRDIYQNRSSDAILTTLALAGIDRQEAVSPQQLLGAFILHGVGPRICDESLAHIQKAQHYAAQLKLLTFEDYLKHLAQLVTDLKTVFTPKSSPVAYPKFLPYRNALAQATTAAESYLLADRLFQSSWAIQRGLPDTETLTARAFPAGLVVENLCRCEHSLGDAIDQVFTWLQASGFRYYDNFPQLPPDADDLGLLLRLSQFATKDQQALYEKILEQPLSWMQRSILPSGEIPVWFAAGPGQDSPIRVWGHSCATTETNLLLGLIDLNKSEHRGIIREAAAGVIARFLSDGLAASLYYVQPYTIWSGLRLIEQGRQFFETSQPARSFFAARFEALGQSSLTPQTAAFQILSKATLPTLESDTWPWLKRLLKSQRHDGSWGAEPLFLVPHRSGVAWYASRLVTSSYCYMALKQCP